MICFLFTICRKFRLRFTIGLISTSKQINEQTFDLIFWSIIYLPILQRNSKWRNGMVIKCDRYRY